METHCQLIETRLNELKIERNNIVEMIQSYFGLFYSKLPHY